MPLLLPLPPPLPPLQVGETYNIGTQKERSVLDVARDICIAFNLDPEKHVVHVRDRAFNDRRYFMCAPPPLAPAMAVPGRPWSC